MGTQMSVADNRVAITFHLPACLWAESISVVGDFNNWDPGVHPLHYSRAEDEWQVTVLLQAGRTYRYRFVLDGHEQCMDRESIVDLSAGAPKAARALPGVSAPVLQFA